MKQLLFIEDDKAYRDLLTEELSKAGYTVDATESPIKALELIAKNDYDIVVSDLNLPIMSGVDLTESIKNISQNTICVILTGDPDESSELRSIQNDIDLYIEKNRSIYVIIKYLDNLIENRNESSGKDLILRSKSENIEFNVSKHLVSKNGESIILTQKEYEILYLFLRNRNKVLSREYIIEHVWEENAYEHDPRLVDAHVRALRDKLKSMSIVTVRGHGYRWNELV